MIELDRITVRASYICLGPSLVELLRIVSLPLDPICSCTCIKKRAFLSMLMLLPIPIPTLKRCMHKTCTLMHRDMDTRMRWCAKTCESRIIKPLDPLCFFSWEVCCACVLYVQPPGKVCFFVLSWFDILHFKIPELYSRKFGWKTQLCLHHCITKKGPWCGRKVATCNTKG